MAHVSLYARSVVPLTVLTAGLLAPTAARADAAERDRATVVVRVYEAGSKSPTLTKTLGESMTRLLDRVNAKIDVELVDCAQQNACVTPAPDLFVLRLKPGHHPVAAKQCGEAVQGQDGRRGVLMTVFRGCVHETRKDLRADAIAQQGAAFGLLSLTESDILGTVVVHELIHLVLPGETHGKGLFKATLDARDWLEVATGWPHLDSALVTRLGRALAPQPVTQSVVAHRRTVATASTSIP